MESCESHATTNHSMPEGERPGSLTRAIRHVGDRGLFRGHALNAIDAKGRVAIPANIRKTIESNSGQLSFVIGKREGDPCLIGYDQGWAATLKSELRTEEARERDAGRAFDKNNLNRRAFGNTDDVVFDASGRFIMPKFFRDKAQIGDWVLFLGTADDFEMWNPHLLIATPDVDEETKDLARYLLAERKVAL